MPLDDIGFMWPFNIPTGYRNQRHDHTTMADGGKGSKLDAMIDDDGPPSSGTRFKDIRKDEEERLRKRKHFPALNSVGLYQGTKE